MEELNIKVVLDEGAFMPDKAHREDAGFDLRVPEKITIEPHGSIVVDTKVHMAIPAGYVGFIKSKSGLNVKCGLRAEGVIDAGYTGPIVVKMYNDTDNAHTFERGDKLTQLVILPIPMVELTLADSLEETARGDGGFGSSGK
ncbi:MAG: dUTP diphosphatase [Lachnospiraceae bacterium]|nr:dUTP diphosphatase [Lachnospiraceae bacterium]